jgi:hypothetical protein
MITAPGDPPPNPKYRWVLPLLLLLLATGMIVPLAVVRYHNSVIEENQNAMIDALREYARQQAAFQVREKRYASGFSELGGNWGEVKDITSPKPTVFHGYRFRAFVSRAAINGSAETKFIDENGRMTGGYALMAIPVGYGYTARMTFFISSPGDILYYHDLGVKTDTVARTIDQYYVPPGAGSLKGIEP